MLRSAEYVSAETYTVIANAQQIPQRFSARRAEQCDQQGETQPVRLRQPQGTQPRQCTKVPM